MYVFTQGIAALSPGLGSNGPLDRQKSDADKAGHCPSKLRKRCELIPNITFIKFHLITFQECTQFILKRNVFMVFVLAANVLANFLDGRLTYRNHAVAASPVEIAKLAITIA